jgi:hypothetical protein
MPSLDPEELSRPEVLSKTVLAEMVAKTAIGDDEPEVWICIKTSHFLQLHTGSF